MLNTTFLFVRNGANPLYLNTNSRYCDRAQHLDCLVGLLWEDQTCYMCLLHIVMCGAACKPNQCIFLRLFLSELEMLFPAHLRLFLLCHLL